MDDVAVAAIREKMATLGVTYARASELYLQEKGQMLDGQQLRAEVAEQYKRDGDEFRFGETSPTPRERLEHYEAMAAEETEHELANVGSVHSTEKGSGARYNLGKPPLNFIPVYMILRKLSYYINPDDMLHRKCIGILELLAQWQQHKIPISQVVQGCTWEDYEEATYVWEYGAAKYAAWNWAKGMQWSIPVGCILRHIRDIIVKGETHDPESTATHWGHVMCNLQMLEHFTFTYTEGDDRPPREIW